MTLEDVIYLIQKWLSDGRTGSIRINMFKGGISNVNLVESIKTLKEGLSGEDKGFKG